MRDGLIVCTHILRRARGGPTAAMRDGLIVSTHIPRGAVGGGEHSCDERDVSKMQQYRYVLGMSAVSDTIA